MTPGMNRAGFLRRGAVGSGALLVSASGLSTLGFADAASAATPSDADLAYLRLLIAAELLAVDFHSQALASGELHRAAHAVSRRIRADENAHYGLLASLMTGCRPERLRLPDDIDFSYPKGTFASRRSILGSQEARALARSARTSARSRTSQTPELRLRDRRRSPRTRRSTRARSRRSGGEPVIGKALAPAMQIGAVSDVLDEVRELSRGEAAVHGERGGGGAGDQPRHAASLGSAPAGSR